MRVLQEDDPRHKRIDRNESAPPLERALPVFNDVVLFSCQGAGPVILREQSMVRAYSPRCSGCTLCANSRVKWSNSAIRAEFQPTGVSSSSQSRHQNTPYASPIVHNPHSSVYDPPLLVCPDTHVISRPHHSPCVLSARRRPAGTASRAWVAYRPPAPGERS